MTLALVTGAAGFIGSHLTERCLDVGWRVIAVDDLAPYYDRSLKRANAMAFAGRPACHYLEQDLLDLDLPDLMADVDVVFHLAAQAGVRASWGESFDVYTQANVTLMQRLLEAARRTCPKMFVFASSSSVYGDAEMLPACEDSVLRPVSPYGATKVLGENLAYLYWKNFQVPTVGVRPFSVYGPRQRPDMAFNRLIACALAGREFTLLGDGHQTRDFTFVTDIVAGVIAAAERGRPGGVYNLGGGITTSMNDAIEIVSDLLGPIDVRRTSSEHGDARHTQADISRARADLGYSPAVALAPGLRAQVEWQKESRVVDGELLFEATP